MLPGIYFLITLAPGEVIVISGGFILKINYNLHSLLFCFLATTFKYLYKRDSKLLSIKLLSPGFMN